jgi:phosphohistidine phosphatase
VTDGVRIILPAVLRELADGLSELVVPVGGEAALDVLLEVPDSVNTVLMIGHAPGIPVLATALARDGAGSTDAAERLSQGFPTSGLAVLGFEGRWSALAPGTAYLQEFVVPRG